MARSRHVTCRASDREMRPERPGSARRRQRWAGSAWAQRAKRVGVQEQVLKQHSSSRSTATGRVNHRDDFTARPGPRGNTRQPDCGVARERTTKTVRRARMVVDGRSRIRPHHGRSREDHAKPSAPANAVTPDQGLVALQQPGMPSRATPYTAGWTHSREIRTSPATRTSCGETRATPGAAGWTRSQDQDKTQRLANVRGRRWGPRRAVASTPVAAGHR
jgi:hypothetical protein